MKISWLPSMAMLALMALTDCASSRKAGEVNALAGGLKSRTTAKSDTPQILRDALARKNNKQPAATDGMEVRTIYKYDTIRKTIYIYDTIRITMNADYDDYEPLTSSKRKPTATTTMRRLKKENEDMKEEISRLQLQINGSPPSQYRGTDSPIFGVQIAAFKYKLTNVAMTFATLSLRGERIAEEYYPDDPKGFPFKYIVGEFYSLDDAIKYCQFINNQNVINGAFVVSYYNDKRITIKEAKEIIERQRKF